MKVQISSSEWYEDFDDVTIQQSEVGLLPNFS